MTTKIKIFIFLFLAIAIGLSSCKKDEYSLGDLTIPSEITFNAVVAGVDENNPAGDGTGSVTVNLSASNAITYKIDFGDGNALIAPSGKITYKYSNPGTFNYIITAFAIGKGGTSSTLSKKITVWVNFSIPTEIVASLTNNTSKTWVIDNLENGHFGVGPGNMTAANGNLNSLFSPSWYAASPNQRAPEAYDDEVTFTLTGPNKISMNVDNKGLSFSIGAATTFYGFSGGDGVYAINTGGTKALTFMNATSESTTSLSTRIQFVVPGNGIIVFGTGGNTYEILSVSATSLFIRNIGIDGNAWYQKFKVKP